VPRLHRFSITLMENTLFTFLLAMPSSTAPSFGTLLISISSSYLPILPPLVKLTSLSLSLLSLAKREASIPNPKGLKPEIHHQFRQAEKRPPPAVSLTFSGLVVGVPLLFLIIGVLSIFPILSGGSSNQALL